MGQAQVFENLGRAWASLCSVDTALDLSNFRSTFSFVLLTFLLILVLFHGASDINLLVELNMAGKNQRIELMEEFISALREEVGLWDAGADP